MKAKSENTAKSAMIFVSLLMIIKTLFTQPIYNKLPFLGYSGAYSVSEILSAVGALILSVLFSVILVKAVNDIGENATPVMLLAVAEPLFITTVSSLFHAAAAMITVAWIAFCLTSKNKVASAAVSVVAAAIISFIMPNAIFSYVLLGVIVMLVSVWSDSKVIGIVSAAVSAAASVALTVLIDVEARMNMKISGVFYSFGGNECNPLSFENLFYNQKLGTLFSRLGEATVASLPVIAAVIFVAVETFRYKPDYTDNKKTSDTLKTEKILTVVSIAVPYAVAVVASLVCTGVSGIMGFNVVPVVIILAFAFKGNKAVAYSLDKLGAFAKAHPVVAVVALVWLAANTTEFAMETKLFDYTTQFVM